MRDDTLGKKAEARLRTWLDRPDSGYSLDRLKDQMTGFYGSRNICDFVLFKSPNLFYIESKATYEDRFDFSMISGFNSPSDCTLQFGGLLSKSTIDGVFGAVVVLFAAHRRAFILDIRELDRVRLEGVKSLNIKKEATWPIRYREIATIPSRKEIPEYTGRFSVI